MRQTWKTVG